MQSSYLFGVTGASGWDMCFRWILFGNEILSIRSDILSSCLQTRMIKKKKNSAKMQIFKTAPKVEIVENRGLSCSEPEWQNRRFSTTMT